jgi:Na+-transporting NADH:ubiquinone oxidoreductase subunit NqrB
LFVAAAATAVAIGSKFVIRRRNRHIFNPSALGIAFAVGVTDHAWIAPSQWGSGPLLAFAIAGLGLLVVHRAARSDVTLAFLAAYAVIVLGRSWWMAEPWSIPVHRLQNGALLLFAFFMISDPKTIPASRLGRCAFACFVAGGAGVVGFLLHGAGGPIWALVALAPVVPLIDRVLPASPYAWRSPSVGVPGPALHPLRTGRMS